MHGIGSPPESREPSIRVVLMPKDTNAHGTIFGGVILSYIDQAAAVEAKQHGASFIVTVAMREVVFHEPVYVGDLVSFYTRLVKIGRTSITVSVEVFARRSEGTGGTVKVTEAEVTFVNLDENRKPLAIPRKTCETEPGVRSPLATSLRDDGKGTVSYRMPSVSVKT